MLRVGRWTPGNRAHRRHCGRQLPRDQAFLGLPIRLDWSSWASVG